MRKRGLIGIIILSVLGVLLVGGSVTGIYLYNYHVFETVRVCIGEGVDTEYPCGVVGDCIDAFDMSSVDLGDMPEFLEEMMDEVVNDVVYCDATCFVRDVRGINRETFEIEMLDGCEENEKEVAIDIRGKEGLAIMKWMKSMEK